jgi:hypothetical protein
MAKVVQFIVLMWAFSCQQRSAPEPDQINYVCGQIVSRRMFNIKGASISYDKGIDRYYLNEVNTSTQLRRISVFCELPEAYKTYVGKTINFDGRFSPVNYKDSTGENGRLIKYFSPAQVEHVAIDKIN